MVKDVGQELEEFYQVTTLQLSEYEKQHNQWMSQVEQERIREVKRLAREKEERERQLEQERIKQEQEEKERLAREKEERERKEKERIARENMLKEQNIRKQALELSEQLGKLVINYAYGGGNQKGVSLINYEYFESSSTYRFEVQLNWNSTKCYDAGTAIVKGVITATSDSADKWQYGKNYRWNPTSQSDIFNQWMADRAEKEMESKFMEKMLGGLASPCM